MKKAVHFGAGNIGRGFLGQLYSQSGWETVFVDVAPTVLNELNRRGGYQIHIVGENSYVVDVRNVRAVDGNDEQAVATEVETADIISTAVGQNVLPHIVSPLAAGLERRAANDAPPVNILLCENMLNAAETVRGYLTKRVGDEAKAYLESKVGFVETVISRMVPITPPEKRETDALYIAVEEYSTLPIDASALVAGDPGIEGLVPTENLPAFTERKLFLHNGPHFLLAVWGHEKGFEYVWQSAEDEEIIDRVEKAFRPVQRALVKKYSTDPGELTGYVTNILERTRNRALGDTVSRVGRDPARKLGRKDRLVGAALVAMEFGEDPGELIKGIVSALNYCPPDDGPAQELQEQRRSIGDAGILESICGLHPNEPLFGIILESLAKQ